MQEINLCENEKLEDLQCEGLFMIQNKNLYNFTCDSVILANYILSKPKNKLLEIGTGSGVISILLTKKTEFDYVDAIEIQKEVYDLAQKNIKLNLLENKIFAHNIDIQSYAQKKENIEKYDIVFSNPPYKKCGTSFLNNCDAKAVSRHEVKLNLKELCNCAKKLLKYGGKFYVMYDADRCSELLCELTKNSLEPKEMYFTYASANKNAQLVIVMAVKGGKSGLKVLPAKIVNDQNGKYIN